MSFNVANRKVHHYASFAAAIPLLVIIASGLLLQLKKQFDWVQPPEQRGTGKVPAIGFDQILTSIQGVPDLDVRGWSDVNRLDVRPDRGLVKVTLHSGWEAQVDLGTGRVLQTAYRRSDVIETIHDGSFFAGDWTKLGLFFPAGLTLLLLWLSGVWMVWVQFIGKRRRRRKLGRAAAIVLLAGAFGSAVAAQQPRLTVDPIVGHWETVPDGRESAVLADARKWKTEPATTPFPVAAVSGIRDFTSGVLRVQFKLIGGESDQTVAVRERRSPAYPPRHRAPPASARHLARAEGRSARHEGDRDGERQAASRAHAARPGLGPGGVLDEARQHQRLQGVLGALIIAAARSPAQSPDHRRARNQHPRANEVRARNDSHR